MVDDIMSIPIADTDVDEVTLKQSVPCPVCGAEAGQPCQGGARKWLRIVHLGRALAAKEANKQ